MNREKYAKYRGNLPDTAGELVIQGGCHAGFGYYGPQKGDGVPTISAQEQITVTADAIAKLMDDPQETRERE